MKIDPNDIPLLARALADYPANGKPDLTDPISVKLREYGLIEERHTKKHCPTCGTERPDYHWYAITPAGRIFMAASGWAL